MEKLKLLAQVQDVLSTKCLHSELLDSGVLGGERRGAEGVAVLGPGVCVACRAASWGRGGARWCARRLGLASPSPTPTPLTHPFLDRAQCSRRGWSR